MKQWDVHLRYTNNLEISVEHLNNRLHPERYGSDATDLWLVLRQRTETLTDAIVTAIARVEELAELELEAVWAEEAVLVAFG